MNHSGAYMTRLHLFAAGVVSLTLASVAWAQLNEVVVTANRVSGDDYSRIPAIAIERRADFLVQRVQLTNDTRDSNARHAEIHQTVRDLVKAAASRSGIALGFGDEFLIPITAEDFRIPLDTDKRRPDTTSTALFVKLALAPKDDIKSALRTLEDFIAKAKVSGRAEIERGDEVALSIVDPERYRYEIIAKIVEDARRLQMAIGTRCRVDISGLSNRVSWQRSDISQLTLYIPYEVELSGCE